jgi:hypothetical protein
MKNTSLEGQYRTVLQFTEGSGKRLGEFIKHSSVIISPFAQLCSYYINIDMIPEQQQL